MDAERTPLTKIGAISIIVRCDRKIVFEGDLKYGEKTNLEITPCLKPRFEELWLEMVLSGKSEPS